jgi:hypothetical protein
VDWAAVDRLIAAVRPALIDSSEKLRDLLEKSNARLGWQDPLLCDLGVHRWLHSENAYSDWLAWALETLKEDPGAVLRVLGQEVEGNAQSKCQISREVWLPKGHEGQQGQIDLLIEFSDPLMVIGVEVKTCDENYKKQKGYLECLREKWPLAVGVLIDVKEKGDSQGFGFRSWADVSLALRSEIAARKKMDPAGGMLLGLVGAIEQNLLGMKSVLAKWSWRKEPVWVPQDIRKHLEKATGG